MRFIRTAVCLILCSLLLMIDTVAVAPQLIPTFGTAVKPRGITSRVAVQQDITEEVAAERLYYLGILSGKGMKDGYIDFALSAPLTRLESFVLLSRLLGMETAILEEAMQHPFRDVPAWGAPYVGYFYDMGLIRETDGLFSPDATVTTNDFMQVLFYALGYAANGNTYELERAAEEAITAGICTEKKNVVTRGDAAVMMFRTLNATMSGSEKLLSQWLVELRSLSYRDIQFLLWEEDTAKTDAYIAVQGYTTEKVLPDGKYTIVLDSESARCLNVLVDGANRDYEGVGISVWKRTDDVSQKFRVERTENGTYRLYSCASGGGYKRMLGYGYYKNIGLFSDYSQYAGEYYIRCSDSGDGTWTIHPASEPEKVIASSDRSNGDAVVYADPGTEGMFSGWRFEFDGVVNEEGYEYAIYPSVYLCVTQGAYDTYSHQRQNALDIYSLNGSVYAPFTGKIVRIDRGYSLYNTVWLQSCDKVVFADGSVDYMTVVFMHDNNVANLSVGQIVGQGEYFYDMGVAGGATGSHVHIACLRGQYKNGSSLTGSGDVYVEDAFFLPHDLTVMASYGLDWVYLN